MYLKYEEEMMDARNEIMANQVKNYLKQYKNTFFAVGAAHMDGPTGVIRLLRDAGYTVEEIPIR